MFFDSLTASTKCSSKILTVGRRSVLLKPQAQFKKELLIQKLQVSSDLRGEKMVKQNEFIELMIKYYLATR